MPENLPAAVVTAALAFAATNIDDLFLVTLWFAQPERIFARRSVVLGQYLGFAALVVLSLGGYAGSLVIPQSWIGLLGLAPIAIGLRQLMKKEDEGEEAAAPAGRVLQVAAVTFANGGDNIGIYVPLFAASGPRELAVTLVVFLTLMAVLLAAGWVLARQPLVAKAMARHSRWWVGLVLIGLGIYILVENGTLAMVWGG